MKLELTNSTPLGSYCVTADTGDEHSETVRIHVDRAYSGTHHVSEVDIPPRALELLCEALLPILRRREHGRR